MKPNTAKAILGGLSGTLVMTLMMYFVAPMMGVHMDIPAMLGGMLGGWAMGLVMHFVLGGVVFPLVYTRLLYRLLPGSATVKGAAFGVVLWLVSQLMVMPMMGVGVFSARAGGMMASMASLLGHLVYGGLLGLLAGSAVLCPAASTQATHPA